MIPRERREQYGVRVKILQSGCHYCFVYTAWNKRLEMVPSLPGSQERVQNIITEVRGKDYDSIYEDVGITFPLRVTVSGQSARDAVVCSAIRNARVAKQNWEFVLTRTQSSTEEATILESERSKDFFSSLHHSNIKILGRFSNMTVGDFCVRCLNKNSDKWNTFFCPFEFCLSGVYCMCLTDTILWPVFSLHFISVQEKLTKLSPFSRLCMASPQAIKYLRFIPD